MSEQELNKYFKALKDYKRYSIEDLEIIKDAIETLIVEKKEIREYERQHPEGLYL